MEKNIITRMAIATKLISRHGNFSSTVKDIGLDNYMLKIYANYNTVTLANFKQSKKWECTITENGFIKITRKFLDYKIYIILW
jgi:hypothetical protein